MSENLITIDKYLKPIKREVILEPAEKYNLLGVKWYGKGVFIRETKLGKEIKAKKLFRVIAGDFIYNRLFAWKSSFAIIAEEFDGCLVSGEFPTFIKRFNDVNINFILQYILLPHNIDKVDKLSTGMSSVSRKRFKENSFLTFVIPDLDKDEQEKISEKISKHINSNQNIVNKVDQQENLLKKLRQAILQEAMEGKLTAEWRKQNPDLVSRENHAARLLEKIKSEKERLVKESKIKKQKPLPSISEDEKPFDLPEGWVICRFGELKDSYKPFSYGVLKPGKNDSNGIRFIKSGDVGNFKVNDDIRFKITNSLSKEYKRTIIDGGEILITLVGASIGRCAIVQNSLKGANVSRAVGVFLPHKNVDSKFINYLLHVRIANLIKSQLLDGSNRPVLNIGTLNNLFMKIPSIYEQQAIVEKVDLLMAKIDALEEQVNSCKEQAEQLMQAVLREAFNGDK